VQSVSVKEFLKSVIGEGMDKNKSATFFMAHPVYTAADWRCCCSV